MSNRAKPNGFRLLLKLEAQRSADQHGSLEQVVKWGDQVGGKLDVFGYNTGVQLQGNIVRTGSALADQKSFDDAAADKKTAGGEIQNGTREKKKILEFETAADQNHLGTEHNIVADLEIKFRPDTPIEWIEFEVSCGHGTEVDPETHLVARGKDA